MDNKDEIKGVKIVGGKTKPIRQELPPVKQVGGGRMDKGVEIITPRPKKND